jgi:hypothetical protein
MKALSAGSLLSYEPADTSEPILEITISDALRAAAAAWHDRPALIEGLFKRALRRRWTFTRALQEANLTFPFRYMCSASIAPTRRRIARVVT